MKTLYVHIGMPKTGTTSLQKFCYENQKILNQKGYDYPMFPHIYGNTVARARNGHFLVPSEFSNNQEVFRKNMDAILEKFQTYSNIILSDEALWTAPSRYNGMWETLQAESSKGGFQVKIIVYLRRQDLYLSSAWNQYIKGRNGTITWEDYVKKPGRAVKMDYGINLEYIVSIWGREAVTVRRFEPKYFVGGSIYADFLQTIGLDLTDEYSVSKYVRNPRLAGNTHEIMRIINGMPGMDYEKSRYFSQMLLSYADLSGTEYAAEMFNEDEARAFMQKYQDENKRVSETFFDGEDLFDMTWKDVPKWEKENPYMHDDMIRFAAACCMQLMEQNEKLRKDITKLKKDVTKLEKDITKIKHPIRSIRKKAMKS